MIRRKKEATSDLKIKVFVLTLFMIIVFLVGYAYVMYEQHVLSYLYFGRIQFDKDSRVFRIFDNRKKFIEGRLGMEIIFSFVSLCVDEIFSPLGYNILDGKPFECVQGNANDGSVCIEWDGEARLYMKSDEKQDGCYTLRWQTLMNGSFPTDCFDLASDNAKWFGGGATKDNDWPLSNGKFDFVPFITGDARAQQFNNAVVRYFISSNKVAIRVEDNAPLHISMNHSNSNKFCLKAFNDNFAFVNRFTTHPELSYRICIAENMLKLHKIMSNDNLWDGLTEADLKVIHTIMEEPVWQIPASSFDQLTESVIFNYTEEVNSLGYLKSGHILVNEFWQKEIGDFTVDVERFERFAETVSILHKKGFRIVLTVQPFISTDSSSFSEAVNKKLLIYERLSERSIPALTRYKSAPSTGVLDITTNASFTWLQKKLKKIAKDYQIDSFFLDFGTAYNMPHYYQCSKSLLNPDQYKTIFGSKFEDSIKIMAYSGAISPPKLPAFLSLPPVNASWEGLRSILPTALTYGVIGFPFIIPGAVGGDYYVPGNDSTILSYHSLDQPQLPDQELFVRWFQLSTFLPSIRFSHLPEEYKSDFITDIAKELSGLRESIVVPTLKKYLNEAMNDDKPLIRPLWMVDPEDEHCITAENQFSIGQDIIVAPIVYQGQTRRTIYLPEGVWKDGVDGSLRKGRRKITSQVPLDKVAYFIRKPSNSTF